MASIIIAFIFLLFASWNTSPIYSDYRLGVDSIHYMQAGKNILYMHTNGIITSNFSMMSIIQAFGQAIQSGRLGAFIIQVLFFSVYIYLSYIIISLRINSIILKIFIILISLRYLYSTFEGGNLQEEFALPIIAFCIYIGLRDYIWSDGEENPPINAFVFGLCFGILIFLKVISIATLCALIIAISIDLLRSKQYKNFLANLSHGILGITIFLLPIVIYGLTNGNLEIIFSRIFVSGYQYVLDRPDHNAHIKYHFAVILPIMFSIVSAYVERMNRRYFSFIILNSIFMTVALYVGHYYLHYTTLNVITFIISMSVILGQIEKSHYYLYLKKQVIRKNKIIIICFVIIIAISGAFFLKLLSDVKYRIEKSYEIEMPFIDIIEIIPHDEIQEVLAYDVSAAWYYVTNTIPRGHYFGYWMSENSLRNRHVENLVISIIKSKPLWIIYRIENKTKHSYATEVLKGELEANYVKIYSTNIKKYWGIHEVYKRK